MAAPKEPRIVAELGRPETPEETAARKAENSRNHRANQTLRNLVYSLVATVAVVIVLVAVVVRPTPDAAGTVNWHTVAAEAQIPDGGAVSDPTLPDGWTANAAEIRYDKYKTAYWYIGFITPKGEFLALEQRVAADDRWLADHLSVDDLSVPTTKTTGTLDWGVYSISPDDDPGNYATVWESSSLGQFDLYGSATDNDFATLAAAVAKDAETTP